MKRNDALFPLFGLCAALSACGGGTDVAEGGIGGTGAPALAASGRITGFGSIFVNGVEFDTSAAQINTDGASADEAALGVGMVVEVYGTVESDGVSGTAVQVEFADLLEGVVLSNDVAADGSLNIMGQTVRVDGNTVFVGSDALPTLADLAADMVVEVSGYADGAGVIYATRIELKAADFSLYQGSGEAIELKGVIAGLDSAAGTFNLGSLSVDYSNADLPEGGLSDGLYVEVKSLQGFDGSSRLLASEVELEDGGEYSLSGEEGDELELEGVVTTALAGSQFGLNGQVIYVDSATEYTGGAAVDLVSGTELNVRVAVVDGQLLASRIEFELASEVEAEAVGSIDGSARTVSLLGLTFQGDNSTLLPDDLPSSDFWQTSSSVGLSVSGYADDGGTLHATRIEWEDVAAGEAELEGTVEAVDAGAGQFTLFGVTVDASAASLEGLGSIGDLQVGDQVQVSGTWDGSVLSADSVVLEL